MLLKDTPGELDALQMRYVELETRYNQLLFEVNGKNGLRAKAARWDMFAQLFENIITLAAPEQASTAFQYPAHWFSQ